MELKTEIIGQDKTKGIPFRIAFDRFMRENNISKSSLTFHSYVKVLNVMHDNWFKN